MAMPAFLAAIPMPVLIGIPVLGLGVIAWYELVYKKTPAAGSLAPVVATAPAGAPAPPSGGLMGATYTPPPAASRPLNPILVKAASSWPVGSAQYNRLMAAAALPPMMGLVTVPAKPATPPAAATGVLAQAQQSAQQVLAALPSPFPNDQSSGINEQVVRAALGQFISNPTFAQFSTTLTDLQQNGSGPALDAYNTLNRYMQTLQT